MKAKTILKVGDFPHPNVLVTALPAGVVRLINHIEGLSPNDAREVANALIRAADYIDECREEEENDSEKS